MRRVRRKGANKEKVFGCDLLEHLTTTSQEIPLVLRHCSDFVEQNGIVDGIYRLSGVSSNIQKLRGEFESEGTPDLNKDVYLQDIHCVSSLCKAYFRELPNPLLTYQLYDKFAEAVAIQLEEERLVKIADVLKELPAPHYRTLEYLMRHLVRMASYSSETNMHARNLAIVWAPNLLRSKDIEASGFNGTAAFMEVRVQSIVVEFILTHVPQLFPDADVSHERRKSLPSPTAMCAPDEGFFKSSPIHPVVNFGNISPGDGPLPIRPYHAIIEGIDKRKGSLKGRKWMSIFNIGGRFQETKRRHKHSTKEKEKVSLRPARSMDSLSNPYPNEVGRCHGPRPPSIVTASPQPSSDPAPPSGGMGSSEYAVTYRRGTGLVSGGAGTQGTYTALDPDNLGVAGNETVQSRSPGLTSKVGRRAAMHITGPTLVTVPLHITSNLAFGVLQGGGADRVIHRGRDKDGGDKAESKEGGEKPAKKENKTMEWKVEGDKKADEGQEEEEKGDREKSEKGVANVEVNTEAAGGVEGEGAGEEGDDEERRDCKRKQEEVAGGQNVSGEQRENSVNTENESDEHGANNNQDYSGYMHMKGSKLDDPQPAETEHTDVLNSAEEVARDEEEEDHLLSGYVQDNFEFLDQMDCSAMDHMDCGVSYQVDEFSVEPPCYSDEEYEPMEQSQPSHLPVDFQTHPPPRPETRTQSQSELKPHRPLSGDSQNRHTKSLSLPYMTSPVHRPEEMFSDEEDTGDECCEHDYSSDEDESMFVQSLPPDFFLSGFELNTDTRETSTPKRAPAISSEEREGQALSLEMTACKETTDGDRVEVKDKEDRLEENEKTSNEEEIEQLENEMESKATEEPMKEVQSENALTSDVSALCLDELPPPGIEDNEESNTAGETELNEEEEVDGILQSDCPPPHEDIPCATKEETSPFEDCSAASAEHPGSHADEGAIETDGVEEEDSKAPHEKEDFNEMHESADSVKEEDSVDIWGEFEEMICEMIEDEEQSEREGAAGRSGAMNDGEKEGVQKEEEVSTEKKVDATTEASLEGEEETSQGNEGEVRHPEMKHEFEEDEVCSPNLEKATQQKHPFGEEAQHRDGGEVKQPEKENNRKESVDEPYRTARSTDKQPQEVRHAAKESKESREREKSDISSGSVERKLVVSKHPRVYQVKAVPVVPPKPQHCKITALTLRQQQQQRERRDAADVGRDNATKAPAEPDRAGVSEQARDGDDESHERKERPTLRAGAERDVERRNSPLSMCFDEAVAIATLRREKERIRDGEGEVEGLGK